jgi:ferredoxin, 2Fe-2S
MGLLATLERPSVKLVFVRADGARREIETGDACSAMEAAVANEVDGIVAVCRGSCACGTCHVYVPPEWSERVGPASAMEDEILGTISLRRPNSRLSCQIKLDPALDGLSLETPESQ